LARYLAALFMLVSTVCACSPGTTARTELRGESANDRLLGSGARKTVTIAITAPFLAFSLADEQGGSGSGQALQELWLQGLVTSDVSSPAPAARVAARLPSLDDGTMRIETDGKLTVTWRLRDDVLWADGEPVTARDFAFGYQVGTDSRISFARSVLGSRVQTVTYPDKDTLVMVWNEPYYLAFALGTAASALQPLPAHVLSEAYSRGNIEEFENHPYWNSEFFHIGPYRPVRFEPQGETLLQAIPHYFLGKPKVDTIVLKTLADPGATYAAFLALAIDMATSNALTPPLALQLRDRWEATGEGVVLFGPGVTQFVAPQFAPEIQTEAAFLDPSVRRALYHALDRQSWADVVLGESGAVANGLLPPNHHLNSHTRDSLAAYTYDARQATSLLAQAGWNRGPDGSLTNVMDGRDFRAVVWSTNESEAVILAGMWKQIGLDTSVQVVPRARSNDRQFMQSYPNVEVTSRGYGDQFLSAFDCSQVPSAANGYAGSNRSHYCNPNEMEPLLAQYRRSLTLGDQGESIRKIADLAARELPVLQTYFGAHRIAVAKGVRAMGDHHGGIPSAGMYGSYYRHAHLWDRE
jgi:peptide/nickel transport system substrate-binding protein